MKRTAQILFAAVFLFVLAAAAHAAPSGAISPKDALEYMKSTPGLVIIDVRPAIYRLRGRFFGAATICASEVGQQAADEMLLRLPADKPTIIHCGNGFAAKRVYDRLLYLRDDMKEVCYIDGAPMFKDYNDFKEAQRKH